MAADDLVYVEHADRCDPLCRDFPKVGATDNLLIGAAGTMMMQHEAFKFLLTDFLTNLKAKDELPSSAAEAVCQLLKEVFAPAERLVTEGVWKNYSPGDRVISFIIAGYTKNFKRPYVFEVGVAINPTNDGLAYISPIRHQKPLPSHVRLGEDHFMERANAGIEPEQSVWVDAVDKVSPDVIRAFPNIPAALQEAVACSVGCIKLEAHFNPQKVGSKVNVVLIDRGSRSHLLSAF